jgi:hypothetical protein
VVSDASCPKRHVRAGTRFAVVSVSPDAPPPAVLDLVQQRTAARAAKDFAESDRLRDVIADAGWVVRDGPDGYALAPRPPYDVLPSVDALPDRSADPDTHRCTVALLVDGWPEDLRTCVTALLEHAPDDVRPGAARARQHRRGRRGARAGRARAGRGAARRAGGRVGAGPPGARPRGHRDGARAAGPVHGPRGRCDRPLLAELDDPGVAAAGWRGVRVTDGWREFEDAGTGEVEALLGYLVAVRRSAALQVPLPAKARFYRNADMEWSFLLREAGVGTLVAVDLPVRQDRHRGYHDSDPAFRDKESKKTYDRFLQRFRGREDLRLPAR